MTALDGRFVAARTVGRADAGAAGRAAHRRNFYSVDSRAVPTPAAWELGWKSAELLIDTAHTGSWRMAARWR
jgi:cobaltochelatase CobN